MYWKKLNYYETEVSGHFNIIKVVFWKALYRMSEIKYQKQLLLESVNTKTRILQISQSNLVYSGWKSG